MPIFVFSDEQTYSHKHTANTAKNTTASVRCPGAFLTPYFKETQ